MLPRSRAYQAAKAVLDNDRIATRLRDLARREAEIGTTSDRREVVAKAWKTAKEAATASALTAFLSENGDAPADTVGEARAFLVEVQADDGQFASASKAGTRKALEDYLARTGRIAHKKEARSLIAALAAAPTCPAGMALIPAGEFWMGSPDGEGEPDVARTATGSPPSFRNINLGVRCARTPQ